MALSPADCWDHEGRCWSEKRWFWIGSTVAGVPPVEAAVATSTRIRSHGSIDGGCRSNSAVRLRRNWALQGDRNARQVPRVLRQALPLRRTDAPSQPSGVHGCPRCQGGFCGRTQRIHRVPWGTACEGSAGANQPKTICSLEGHTVTVNRKKSDRLCGISHDFPPHFEVSLPHAFLFVLAPQSTCVSLTCNSARVSVGLSPSHSCPRSRSCLSVYLHPACLQSHSRLLRAVWIFQNKSPPLGSC